MEDILELLDMVEHYGRLTDKEVKEIDTRDVYGSLLQFQDPYIFVHLVKDPIYRLRDLEFAHFSIGYTSGYTQSKELEELRVFYAKAILFGFPNCHMISEPNIQRLCSEYFLFTRYQEHAIMCRT